MHIIFAGSTNRGMKPGCDFSPLSTLPELGALAAQHVRLHDADAVTRSILQQDVAAHGNRRMRGAVIKTRANARFLNKFTKHGRRASSARAVAIAHAVLLLLLGGADAAALHLFFTRRCATAWFLINGGTFLRITDNTHIDGAVGGTTILSANRTALIDVQSTDFIF